VLWLLRFPSAAAAEPRLVELALKHGLDRSRLLFTDMLPYETHLESKAVCELFLDAFVYNAHGTAEDALWAAVPLLTLPGKASATWLPMGPQLCPNWRKWSGG
jgi:predicted O-linked N-acetylglucosamine transferase (SPINDLY family)